MASVHQKPAVPDLSPSLPMSLAKKHSFSAVVKSLWIRIVQRAVTCRAHLRTSSGPTFPADHTVIDTGDPRLSDDQRNLGERPLSARRVGFLSPGERPNSARLALCPRSGRGLLSDHLAAAHPCPGGGNGSSCPTPAVRNSHGDRLSWVVCGPSPFARPWMRALSKRSLTV